MGSQPLSHDHGGWLLSVYFRTAFGTIAKNIFQVEPVIRVKPNWIRPASRWWNGDPTVVKAYIYNTIYNIYIEKIFSIEKKIN